MFEISMQTLAIWGNVLFALVLVVIPLISQLADVLLSFVCRTKVALPSLPLLIAPRDEKERKYWLTPSV